MSVTRQQLVEAVTSGLSGPDLTYALCDLIIYGARYPAPWFVAPPPLPRPTPAVPGHPYRDAPWQPDASRA